MNWSSSSWVTATPRATSSPGSPSTRSSSPATWSNPRRPLYTGDAFHCDWAADTLDRVKALGGQQLIGGRGAIARGREEVAAAVVQTRDFLLTMQCTVGDAHRS